MKRYDKTFKDKDINKNNNNKSMPLRINDSKLFEKYKIIWTKIEDLKNTEIDALPVSYDRYIKTKVRNKFSVQQ